MVSFEHLIFLARQKAHDRLRGCFDDMISDKWWWQAVWEHIGGRRLVKVKADDGRWSQPECENQDIKSL